MSSEQREKRILQISFFAGLSFAAVEFIFSIFSRSQSALMDAAYDASELIFIALTLFLTPLFHQPISEKRPYGFFQVESIFIIIKGFMMLSVTFGILANVIQSALAGGNAVNGGQVSLFQLVLGIGCIFIYIVMNRYNRSLSSPTIAAELMGWRLDIAYSFGMSLAFFGSMFLKHTPAAFLAPYFDQIIAVLIVVFMLPDNIRMIRGAVKDIFLFPPDDETVNSIKKACEEPLAENEFLPVFYDITRTVRHLWVSIYFEVAERSLPLTRLQTATEAINEKLSELFEDCSCELILTSEEVRDPFIAPEEVIAEVEPIF